MFPPGLEPRTFRVLGERDNHYTTETGDGCAFFEKVKRASSKLPKKGTTTRWRATPAKQVNVA